MRVSITLYSQTNRLHFSPDIAINSAHNFSIACRCVTRVPRACVCVCPPYAAYKAILFTFYSIIIHIAQSKYVSRDLLTHKPNQNIRVFVASAESNPTENGKSKYYISEARRTAKPIDSTAGGASLHHRDKGFDSAEGASKILTNIKTEKN